MTLDIGPRPPSIMHGEINIDVMQTGGGMEGRGNTRREEDDGSVGGGGLPRERIMRDGAQ